MTNSTLAERIRAAQEISANRVAITDKIRIVPRPRADPNAIAQKLEAEAPLDMEALARDYNAKNDAIAKHELETVPRVTVLKLVTEKLETAFVFRVSKGEGEPYCQAMRQVLSRTRKKALRSKTPLTEFRLLTLKIEEKEEYDVVTLIRTRTMTTHEESVYDEIVKAFAKQVGA